MRNVRGPQSMNPTLPLHFICNIISSKWKTCKAKFKQFVVKLHFKDQRMGRIAGTQCTGRKETISMCCVCLLFCYMAHLGGVWTPNNRWWPGGNAFVDLLCAEKNHHIARQDGSANSCLSQLLAQLNKKKNQIPLFSHPVKHHLCVLLVICSCSCIPSPSRLSEPCCVRRPSVQHIKRLFAYLWATCSLVPRPSTLFWPLLMPARTASVQICLGCSH